MRSGGVAGLVLAAGAGRRFGAPKALVTVRGERLVDRAVRVLRESDLDPVVVVGGAAALDVAGAVVVPNPGWAEGIGASLRAGLEWLGRETDAAAVAVMLVDQPGIGPQAVRQLTGRASGARSLAVATYAGRRSHPVLLGRGHWPDICASARGEVGARGYLGDRGDVVEVDCTGLADDADIDVPEDLAAYLLR